MRQVASSCIDDKLIDDETFFDARKYISLATPTCSEGSSTFPLMFDQLDSLSWTHSRWRHLARLDYDSFPFATRCTCDKSLIKGILGIDCVTQSHNEPCTFSYYEARYDGM